MFERVFCICDGAMSLGLAEHSFLVVLVEYLQNLPPFFTSSQILGTTIVYVVDNRLGCTEHCATCILFQKPSVH